MRTSTFKDYIVETIREVRAFRQADTSKLKEWARVNPVTQQSGYVRTIGDQSWDALANQARGELKARRDDMQEMAQRQERIAGLFHRTDALATSIKAIGVPIAKHDNWTTIRKQVKKKLQSRGIAPDRVNKVIARLEAADEREVRNAMSKGIEGSGNQLNGLAQVHLTAMAGATLALAVARFNQLVVAGTTPTASPAAFCDQTESRLATAEREVWKALREGDLFAARAHATDLGRLAASSVLDGALPHGAALAARRHSPTTDFIKDGRLALRLGDLIRDLLGAVVLGHYVAWLAKWPENTTPTRHWLRAARDLPFPGKFKAPHAASIATLAAKPTASDGKALTIEGVLGSVQIVHRGRKAISSAPVSDGNGKSVTIAIPYIKLDSGGMVPGAYVRVSGTWQKGSTEVDGPALLIDRLNLGELSRQSWSDWATLQLRPILESVPHGLAAGWSWEPGVDGAGNPLRYRTWFPKRDRSN